MNRIFLSNNAFLQVMYFNKDLQFCRSVLFNHSLGRYFVCLHQSWVRLVNLAILVYLPAPTDTKGKPAIEIEHKSSRSNFLNSGLNHTRLSNYDELDCHVLNLKERVKMVTSLLRNLTLNICSVQIQ